MMLQSQHKPLERDKKIEIHFPLITNDLRRPFKNWYRGCYMSELGWNLVGPAKMRTWPRNENENKREYYSEMKTNKTLLSVAALLSWVTASHANIISYFDTVFDTDYVSAGISGVRGGDGTANIVVSGVSGTVKRAILTWHGPSNNTDPGAFATVKVGGVGVTGTNIGIADDNCWMWQVSHAYSADITSLVSGNGTYTLSQLIQSQSDINGASIQVFYDDGNPNNNRDVVMFTGNDSNIASVYDPTGWDVTLAGVKYDTGSAFVELMVGDGQAFVDSNVLLNGSVMLSADGSGHPFAGDTLPNDGTASSTNGGLWDIRSADITTWLSSGTNDLRLTAGTASDCLSLVVVSIDLPAGAAPPPPSVPDGGCTLALFGLALGAIRFAGRKMAR